MPLQLSHYDDVWQLRGIAAEPAESPELEDTSVLAAMAAEIVDRGDSVTGQTQTVELKAQDELIVAWRGKENSARRQQVHIIAQACQASLRTHPTVQTVT